MIHDPELGIDYSRLVHGEQRFVHTRPVRAGTPAGRPHHRGHPGRRRNDIVTTRADVTTVAGEPVLTAYATLVARGTAA